MPKPCAGLRPAHPNFDLLADSDEVRLPIVARQWACSPATVWRRVRSGLIPQPIRRGGVTSWRVGDIRAAKRGG